MPWQWKYLYEIPAKGCLFLSIAAVLPCICISACAEVYREGKTTKKRRKRDKKRREDVAITPRPRVRERRLSLPAATDTAGKILENVHDQDQSPLFNKLPPEIRLEIFKAVFRPSCPNANGVVHLAVMMKRLGQMPCSETNREVFGWQHRCWGLTWSDGLHHSPRPDDPQDIKMLSILLSCRRAYSEAIDLLYSTNTFNIRQTGCLSALASTLLPSRLNAIRHLHIDTIYHGFQRPSFVGFLSDDLTSPLNNYASWSDNWRIIATMQGLRRLTVTLSQFIETGVDFAEVVFLLTPLAKVKHVKEFEVQIAWDIDNLTTALVAEMPFKLVRRERPIYLDKLLIWPPHLVPGSFVRVH